MIIKNIKFLAAALVVFTINANATLITFETRALTPTIAGDPNGQATAENHGVDQLDFAGSWLAQGETLFSTELTEFNRVHSGADSFSHVQIDLAIERDSANWVFELGLDAGFGAAVYLDNQLITSTSDDLWWGYNWNNSDVFTVTLNDLTRENKVIDIYWAEHCCDGASSIRFKNDVKQWDTLSVSNLADASIPEPASIALIGMGLLGLAGRRRFKK